MQSITPVTHAQLLATGKDHPSLKLEAFVRGSWVDFTSLYPPEDLIGWWPLNKGSGATAYDVSLNENNGVITGAIWEDSEISGKWLNLNGVGDHISATIPVDTSGGITITGWFTWRNYPIENQLITNPSFETDLTGWTAYGNHSIERITTDANFGIACAKITATGEGTSGHLIRFGPVEDVEEDTSRDLIFYAKSISGSTTLHVEMWGGIGGGNVTLTASWKKFTLTPTQRVGNPYLYFWLTGAGVFHLDNVKLGNYNVASVIVNIGNGHGTEDGCLDIIVNPDNNLAFRAFGISYANKSGFQPTTVPQFFVFSIAADGSGKAYLNNELVGSDSTTIENFVNGNLFLGQLYAGTYNLDGNLDEFRIYKRELTATERTTLYELKGKSYLESVSVSLGGAGMSPNPIGGTVGATLSNEDGIFHPQHPNSAYVDWLQTGRQIRASVGAKYAGTDYLWQRVIGYIDEPRFEAGNQKINIAGADYMKLLEDVQLRNPDALWRATETFDSIASDGRGTTERYTNADAMNIPDEVEAVPNWIDSLCTISPLEGATDNEGDTTEGNPTIAGMGDTSDFFIGGYVRVSGDAFPAGTHEILDKTADSLTLDANATASVDNVTVNYYVGHVLLEEGANGDPATIRLNTVFVPVAGVRYSFRFQYKAGPGAGKMRVVIYHFDDPTFTEITRKEGLELTDWTEESVVFTAANTDPISIWIYFYDGAPGEEWYFDLFTIRTYVPPDERYYKLQEPVAPCNGIYRVLLDEGKGAGFEDVWQGEEDEGYYYTPDAEPGPDPPAHPPKIVWFDKNRKVAAGTANLKIQYFITVPLENMVADILVTAGKYADRAAALAAITGHADYVDPAIDIDQCWFKVGEPALGAIKMICERANYRFYFDWDGTPVFRPAPSYSDALTDGGLNEWLSATNLEFWSESISGTSTVNREAGEANKVEGAYSCRFDVDAGNALVAISSSTMTLTPLKRYKLVIWYRNSLAGKTAAVSVYDSAANVYLKGDGTWNVGNYYITLSNSTIWKKYELYFYGHPDYSSYKMELKRAVAASSSIYFDKVSVWREEFTFTTQAHIESSETYQDRGEIWNRIIIEGAKRADPVSLEEARSSEFIGEAADDAEGASIDTYGERTKPIKNHLFQNQASIDAMCATLLAEYKDPKWYADIEVKWNPAPLQMGDMVGWKERLSPTLEITRRGIVRDIKIEKFITTYKCEGK